MQQHPFETPSKERPPFGDLRLAPLLDAQVEIAAVAGDVDTSRSASDALQKIANTYQSPSLVACAALSNSRTALLEGDLPKAIEMATAAIVAWTDVGAPYETAVARMVLADAHQRSGNRMLARMERQAAKTAFEVFGAVLSAERAASLAEGADSVNEQRPSVRLATFTCESGIRTVSFAGETVSLRDLKGFRYIERLLDSPNREFHVLDLVAVEQGALPTIQSVEQGIDLEASVSEGAVPVLDEQARQAYRRRLIEVDDDIQEATEMNDVGRIELAQRDRDYLVTELKRAVGLGGRHRSVGGSSERARTAVARSLRYALGRLAEHHPALASHLEQSVNTGTYCSYTPDILVGVDWRT